MLVRKILFGIVICTALSATSQDGKLISKTLVDLSEQPFWPKISKNDSIIPQFDYLNKMDLYEIVYLSDSLEIKGFVCEPKADGKYPVVLFNRGGNRDYGKNTIMSMISFAARISAEGYVLMASNYRGADGAGGVDEFGGDDIHDVLNLKMTASELEKADTNRMGMFGWSRGAIMTYLALKNSDSFKTAVIGNGPTDLKKSAEERPKMEKLVYSQCIPNYADNYDEEMAKRSAIKWVDSLPKSTSILLICGSKDKMVNPDHTRQMAKQLEEKGFDFEFQELDTDHGFDGKRQELFDLLIAWFDEHL